MRIAQVLDRSSRLAGGISECVRGLSLAMNANGDDVVVISGRDEWSDADLPGWGAVTPRLSPTAGVADGVFGRALTRALLDAEPDVVHLHGVWGVAARATAAWTRRTRGPVVVSTHGMLDPWALGRSAMKKRISSWFWEGRLLGGAHFLHALNPAEAEAIVAAGWRRPVVTIPNGVALPPPGEPVRRADGKRALLFLGRLHPKKGLAPLLQAWAVTPAALRDGWTLRIAGWDEVGLLTVLESLAHELGIENQVEFVGSVYGAEKDAVFRSASAFILPSLSEGLPIAVLEAWSYGLPVFMSAACNLPKGFETGAAFEIGVEPDAITPVLASVLGEDAALRLAGRKGRALVEQDHVWSVIARDMRAAYAGVGQ